MSDDKKDDYQVGYGKPPKHSQFKKGHSGNPKGRPKGTQNFATDLREELRERITLKENGQIKSVTKQRGMIKSAVNNGIQGNAGAARLVMEWVKDFVEEVEQGDIEGSLTREDEELFNLLMGRALSHQTAQTAAEGTAAEDDDDS
ncbi:MAG: DUF5681 domain-containing protein [Pseudomonadota bacterium]